MVAVGMTCRHDLPGTNAAKEVATLSTDIYSTPATAAACQSQVKVSMWAAPAQRTRMPFEAQHLGSITRVSTASTAVANAANGATGDPAFEDPV
jgi:hypothetical protein